MRSVVVAIAIAATALWVTRLALRRYWTATILIGVKTRNTQEESQLRDLLLRVRSEMFCVLDAAPAGFAAPWQQARTGDRRRLRLIDWIAIALEKRL
ncbi:MAG: hypothetical protein J2P54_18875 [Bradyrhizobiaceae bacterium]|nr:hypothetical protein [Bradyrhizobiaceae bacterium]